MGSQARQRQLKTHEPGYDQTTCLTAGATRPAPRHDRACGRSPVFSEADWVLFGPRLRAFSEAMPQFASENATSLK